MRGKGDTPEMMKKFGLAMSLGTVFISYILAGGVIGYFLDKWLGTNPWMFLIFFVLGVGGAIYQTFRISAKLNL
jgi:ATP synthase protein I